MPAHTKNENTISHLLHIYTFLHQNEQKMVRHYGALRHLLLTTAALSSPKYFIKSFTSQFALNQQRQFGISSTRFMSDKPVAGDIVTIDYTLQTPDKKEAPADELLFDAGDDVSFVLHAGNYLSGLHEVVSGLKPGESVEGVEIDAGFGDKNPDMIATIPKTDKSGLDYNTINVGTELMLANGLKAVVTEVTDKDFTIDANPRMAGVAFLADVSLKAVEPGPSESKYVYNAKGVSKEDDNNSSYAVATFALGCFWGGELAFMREDGVVSSKVGYTHGQKEDPTYKEVCSGMTGHTEGIQVVYNPEKVTFERLVNLSMERLGESKFKLNQVGNDRGTQYRHGIYYHDDEQKEVAERILATFGEDCVTECKPAEKFWDAEDYHQQYLLKGGQSAKKNDEVTIRCYG